MQLQIIFFPSVSRIDTETEGSEFVSVMKTSIRSIVLIVAPIFAGMMILSREIITIVYARGEFNELSVKLCSTALFYYSVGMISYGVNEIINKCFYAMKKAYAPMLASLCGIAVTVVLSLFLKNIGIGGLALSASLGLITVTVILSFMVNKIFSGFIDAPFLTSVFKTLLCTAVMAAAGIAVTPFYRKPRKYCVHGLHHYSMRARLFCFAVYIRQSGTALGNGAQRKGVICSKMNSIIKNSLVYKWLHAFVLWIAGKWNSSIIGGLFIKDRHDVKTKNSLAYNVLNAPVNFLNKLKMPECFRKWGQGSCLIGLISHFEWFVYLAIFAAPFVPTFACLALVGIAFISYVIYRLFVADEKISIDSFGFLLILLLVIFGVCAVTSLAPEASVTDIHGVSAFYCFCFSYHKGA